MSRGNVFKLSGNLALGGGTDTYSTNELQSIKSSLRLLKARQQSQKKSEQNIDIGANYGASYSANTAQRSDLRKNDNKDYNYYQNSAKNHVPVNSYDNHNTEFEGRQNKPNSRTSIYENDRQFQARDKTTNYSLQRNQRNEYSNTAMNNKNDYQYGYNDGPSKDQSARVKPRQQQPKYNDEDYYNSKPLAHKNNQDIKPRQQTRPPLRKQQLNQQASNYSMPNQHEDRSIKQVNRQAKSQIVQYDPSTFVECSVGCGRKFNPESISKHQAICYKVFQKKRKQFNTQEQRIIDGEHKKIVKGMEYDDKKSAPSKNAGKGGKNQQKMSKWKAQSLAFRSMLKNNRGEQVSAEDQKQMNQIKDMGMVKCPHCGRSFNQKAGPKHISFCQSQSKKNKMKR